MATGIEAISAVTQAQGLVRDGLSIGAAARKMLDAARDTGTAVPGSPATTMVTPQPQQSAGPATILGSVQMLVALSALSPREIRRREQAARARHALDGLDRLHHELLGGAVHRSTLEDLANWLRRERGPDLAEENSADPDFAGLLREIDLRVRVELAKLDIAI